MRKSFLVLLNLGLVGLNPTLESGIGFSLMKSKIWSSVIEVEPEFESVEGYLFFQDLN